MREVEIPGGSARFKEPGVDDIPGRATKLIKAAAMAAASQLSDYPEVFEPPRKVEDPETHEMRDETNEEQNRRLMPRLSGMKLTVSQAMVFDDLREAVAVSLLESWTLERRLPTFDTIGDLPQDLYEALLEAVGGVSAAQLEANFDPHPDKVGNESDPTGNCGSSSSPSASDPQSTLTPGSSSDTAPSDGDASSPEQ